MVEKKEDSQTEWWAMSREGAFAEVDLRASGTVKKEKDQMANLIVGLVKLAILVPVVMVTMALLLNLVTPL